MKLGSLFWSPQFQAVSSSAPLFFPLEDSAVFQDQRCIGHVQITILAATSSILAFLRSAVLSVRGNGCGRPHVSASRARARLVGALVPCNAQLSYTLRNSTQAARPTFFGRRHGGASCVDEHNLLRGSRGGPRPDHKVDEEFEPKR